MRMVVFVLGESATSGNNLTLKHATGVEIDMHCTGGSGNNFRLKSDSGGIFTIRDHSAGVDRLTIRDDGKIGIGQADPQGDLQLEIFLVIKILLCIVPIMAWKCFR